MAHLANFNVSSSTSSSSPATINASIITPRHQHPLVGSPPDSTSSSNNTFLLSASPSRNRKLDNYKPKVITTVGARPACLVNASVTYVGNDQIYAFGGFDQYTDEGPTPLFLFTSANLLTMSSIQSCTSIEPTNSAMESRGQLW
jgi:hypothetical protein